MTHKSIAETTKISAVVHFLGEDVRNVTFATDVGDGDSAVGDPFPGGGFSVLDVAIAFGHHVVAPYDAGIVVWVGDVQSSMG